MGINFSTPFPNREIKTVVTKAAIEIIKATLGSTSCKAPSPDLPKAMLTPTGAKFNPITMITGATTTGGSNRLITPSPRHAIIKLNRT